MIGMVYHSEIVISIGEMLKKKKDLPPLIVLPFSYKIWLDWKLSLTHTILYDILGCGFTLTLVTKKNLIIGPRI